MSGLAVWNEVSVALYCADIALPDPHPTRAALRLGATARAELAALRHLCSGNLDQREQG